MRGDKTPHAGDTATAGAPATPAPFRYRRGAAPGGPGERDRAGPPPNNPKGIDVTNWTATPGKVSRAADIKGDAGFPGEYGPYPRMEPRRQRRELRYRRWLVRQPVG